MRVLLSFFLGIFLVCSVGSAHADSCVEELGKLPRIVLTGGPSSGKSALIDSLKRVAPQIALVPETATLLLSGGFPPPKTPEQVRLFQNVFPAVQSHLEKMTLMQNPTANLVVLDRVALDGYGFWPGDLNDFLKSSNLDLESEFNAYDWIIFFEMPLERDFGGNNPFRFHTYEQSLEVSRRLKELWSMHPRFVVIPTSVKFELKVQMSLQVIQMIERGASKSEIDDFLNTQ